MIRFGVVSLNFLIRVIHFWNKCHKNALLGEACCGLIPTEINFQKTKNVIKIKDGKGENLEMFEQNPEYLESILLQADIFVEGVIYKKNIYINLRIVIL